MRRGFKKTPCKHWTTRRKIRKTTRMFYKRMFYTGNLNIFSQESVINSVGEFIYKPEEVTFEASLRRYESIFEKDCEIWPDEKKVRLLLGKFKLAEHEKYVNFILPRQPGEVKFRESIQILTKIFGVHCLILVGNVSTLRKRFAKTIQVLPLQLTGTVKGSSKMKLHQTCLNVWFSFRD